jgi:glucose/arabinose dehydrogenase
MMQFKQWLMPVAMVGLLTACGDRADPATSELPRVAAPPAVTPEPEVEARPAPRFSVEELARFDAPWAMTFLPDGRLLISEKGGTLRLLDLAENRSGTISGVPEVAEVPQAGLGDVVTHPDFASNQMIYISYAEAVDDGVGGVVARGRLALDEQGGGALEDLEVIWRQTPQPRKDDDGHFGYRIAFGDDGKLWISSGERKLFEPAQDMNSNLGKIIRLNDDGSVPEDNPFADRGDVAAQVWSLGHRNILGLAFDGEGRLWAHEMGPKDGDELNLIEKGANYGYPIVSNGNHYDGTPIPDHNTRPEFRAPVITWTPVISPAGFIIYDGDLFPDWQGSGFIGGLSSKALVRVEFDGEQAREAERIDMMMRIREVEQGPDGAIFLLEDGTRDGEGRLLRLMPEE